MVVDRLNSQTVIIDIAVPGDFRVKEKEAEMIEQDLALELNSMRKTSAKVVPVVIGALGAVHSRNEEWLALLGANVSRYTQI